MRRDPEQLFELDEHVAAGAPGQAPLLHHLEGFIDAGNAGRLLTEHLLQEYPHQAVARFDVDRLLDYRSRRPPMTYSDGKWTDYQYPELALHRVTDAKGKDFWLLTGPEPDHEWELFTAALAMLADRLDIGLAVSYLGIPAGAPHTRPLGLIAHGTREGLVSGTQQLPDTIELPGSATSLLELRLGEAGRDAAGLAVQVPHYLAQSMYPRGALRLLQAITELTSLELPEVDLRISAERTDEAIKQQVEESGEIAALVRTLEEQHDATAAAEDGLLAEGQPMPTADELAAQFEQFLADQNDTDD